MYAMTLDENLQFCWKEVCDPVRKPGEVLIKTAAAAVNRADLMQKFLRLGKQKRTNRFTILN